MFFCTVKKHFIAILFLSALLFAFRSINELYFAVPPHWPKPEYDFAKNPLTTEKIELGKVLFYDPILSRDNSTSCTSCHSQYTAFAHIDHSLSHGIENRIGTRNAPALVNLAWHKTFMWDGAINHLDMQPLAPITNHDEMDEKIENVVNKLQHSSIYPKLFFNAFHDSIITGEHTLKAISQFVLTIVSANAKYDSVMQQTAHFSVQENKGYELFKTNCATCHKEPLFTNLQFENSGLALDTTLNDIGRMKVTHNNNDSLKFMVPTLRNIEFSGPYMHDGRLKRLDDVLNHYLNGIIPSKTLAVQLKKPIVLSSNEKVDMIAFLLTLTDRKFLFNPKYFYPKDILMKR